MLDHPNGTGFIVIAGGYGYWLNPATRSLRSHFGGQIDGHISIEQADRILFQSGISLTCFGAGGMLWHSDNLSWDGFRAFIVNGSKLRGEAWNVVDDKWERFELDIDTGEAKLRG